MSFKLNSFLAFFFLPHGKRKLRWQVHVQSTSHPPSIYRYINIWWLHRMQLIVHNLDSKIDRHHFCDSLTGLGACLSLRLFLLFPVPLRITIFSSSPDLEQISVSWIQVSFLSSYLSIYSLRSSLAWTSFDSKLRYTSRSRSTLSLLTFSSFESC